MGADDTINYKSTPDWDKEVFRLTDKVGVDHVVEVGGAGTLPKSLNAVRMGGSIAVIGALAGGSGLDPVRVLMKCVRLQGIFVGSREMFENMNRAIALNALRPVIDRIFPSKKRGKHWRTWRAAHTLGKSFSSFNKDLIPRAEQIFFAEGIPIIYARKSEQA